MHLSNFCPEICGHLHARETGENRQCPPGSRHNPLNANGLQGCHSVATEPQSSQKNTEEDLPTCDATAISHNGKFALPPVPTGSPRLFGKGSLFTVKSQSRCPARSPD